MSRTPNEWRFFSENGMVSLVQEFSVTGLADKLGISRSTVDRWTSSDVIPSHRFQVAMSNLRSDFSNLNPTTIGRKITQFITATRIEQSTFATLMGVSDRTVGNWIEGRSKPRNRTLLSTVLTTPRP